MTGRRVVITGTGAVTSVGHSVDSFWQSALAGHCNVTEIPPQWRSYHAGKSRWWAPLGTVDYGAWDIKRADLIHYDTVVLIAIVAAHQALISAGFSLLPVDIKNSRYSLEGVNGPRAGVFVGTTLGGVCSPMDNHIPHLLNGLKDEIAALAAQSEAGHAAEIARALARFPRVSPLVAPQAMPNAIPAALSLRFGLQGPSQAIGIACASSTASLGYAFQMIRAGRLDMVLAGGAEHMGDHAGAYFMGFDRLSTLANGDLPGDQINRPFDRRHSGFLYSEGGAAVLVVESLENALARGATPLAEIVGYGETCDAYSMVAMRDDNLMTRHAYQQALDEAGLVAADIDYINAHGTGTAGNDNTETRLLSELFGQRPVINSTKSLLGHTIGACGALEAVITIRTLREGLAHPCVNLEEPIADLNFARGVTSGDFRHALSANYGFGGHNAVLAMRRFD
ncbi:MAG: beta-ketoacyl-[acyl-carrier-protein] synthase family protein [Gammaproteobacteria bacterium]|nr:beta-ketoacyl-[acyl-carrier-protein] synthase family protein [Gammaproteobacteria bacterium]